MAVCDVCGNDYDKAFEVRTADGKQRTFDSIECAASAIAPRCSHCDCTILGHGIEADGTMYCCAHCAKQAGVEGVADRAGG